MSTDESFDVRMHVHEDTLISPEVLYDLIKMRNKVTATPSIKTLLVHFLVLFPVSFVSQVYHAQGRERDCI